MADGIRVLDCRVDELAANLNSLAGDWAPVVWSFYDRAVQAPCPICAREEPHLIPGSPSTIERRVTVVIGRVQPAPITVPIGLDPRKIPRN